VVSPDEGNAVGVPDLEGHEEQEGLDAVEATVHEVTHEEVVGLGALSSHIEELNQVVELTVNVSANLFDHVRKEKKRKKISKNHLGVHFSVHLYPVKKPLKPQHSMRSGFSNKGGLEKKRRKEEEKVAKEELTVTGESTDCTLLSSIKISRARLHKSLTCFSLISSHL